MWGQGARSVSGVYRKAQIACQGRQGTHRVSREAIIPYSCTGADFGGVHAFVYGAAAPVPRLLGDLPSSVAGGQALRSIHTVTLPALAVLLRERVLQVSGSSYSANTAHACLDLRVTLSYRVASGRLPARPSSRRPVS